MSSSRPASPTRSHPAVRDAAQVKAFAGRVGYPLVLKPDVGVGAAHTFKVTSDAEVDAALAHPLPRPTWPRPSCAAPSSPMTASWTATAHIVFRLSHEYSDGVMESVLEQRDISFWSLQEHSARARGAGPPRRGRARPARALVPPGVLPAGRRQLRRAGGQPAPARRLHDGHDELRVRHRRVPALGPRGRSARTGGGLSYTPRYHVCHSARRASRALPLRPCGDWWRSSAPSLLDAPASCRAVYHSALGNEMYLTRHAGASTPCTRPCASSRPRGEGPRASVLLPGEEVGGARPPPCE